MIRKRIYSHRLVLFALFSCYTCNHLFAQAKANISAGIGIPELINLGVQLQYEKSQMGMSLGFLNDDGAGMFTISGNYYNHFGGLPKFSTPPPWYLKFGLTYLRSASSFDIEHVIFLNARIGREFNFTEKVGTKLDAGLMYPIYHGMVEKQPSSGGNEFDLPLLPSLGVAVFYRL